MQVHPPWREALDAFTRAFGVSPRIVDGPCQPRVGAAVAADLAAASDPLRSADLGGAPPHGPGIGCAARREPGAWWCEGDLWFVQLDWDTSAAFPGLPADPAVRSLLSLALRGSVQPRWQEILVQQALNGLRAAAQGDWERTRRTLADARDAVRIQIPTDALRMPGAFVWVEFHLGAEQSVGTLRPELRSLVEEVAETSPDFRLIGWAETPAVLGFVTADASAAVDGDETEVDSDGGPSPENDERMIGTIRVRSVVQQLLAALESDALLAAQASVGRVVDRLETWPDGLCTLVDACCQHVRFAPGRSVFAWGERPLLQLLAGIGNERVAAFLQAARRRGALTLDPDMAETLQGMLQANLNISEAARLLYLHRNTLMNRIERIRMQTGYDVRQFDDALLLWLAQLLARSDSDRLSGRPAP
ncbi:MAG: helix-turn-helix domain-containing protein [Alicyclobacillus sp.]|nr:helix-turn-helix domain-containing protein [Alicyclobacillus sp.]